MSDTGLPALSRRETLIFGIWEKRRAKGFPVNVKWTDLDAAPTDTPAPDVLRRRMTITLDLLRTHTDRVYQHIVQSDLEAASIAVQRRWPVGQTAKDLHADWGALSEGGVQNKLAMCRETRDLGHKELAQAQLDLLRKAIGEHAPHHLHVLPERISATDDHTPSASGLFGTVKRTRADDLALLDALRRDVRTPNRAVRIADLERRLGGTTAA